MNVDVFLDKCNATTDRIEPVLSAYPGYFHVRWHALEASALYTSLYLASLPLDATNGHTLADDGTPAAYSYGAYGYYAGEPAPLQLPAIGLFDRLALLPSNAGPPRCLWPGVWEAPFRSEDLLRGALHQALEAAFAELREAYAQLRATHPGILELPTAARLLQVTPTALHRALRK